MQDLRFIGDVSARAFAKIRIRRKYYSPVDGGDLRLKYQTSNGEKHPALLFFYPSISGIQVVGSQNGNKRKSNSVAYVPPDGQAVPPKSIPTRWKSIRQLLLEN